MHQRKESYLDVNDKTENHLSFQTAQPDVSVSKDSLKSESSKVSLSMENSGVETTINVFKVIEKQNSSLDSQ